MPQVEIKFTLPEERTEFAYAIHGADAVAALEAIREKLRSFEKYSARTPDEVERLIAALREDIGDGLAKFAS